MTKTDGRDLMLVAIAFAILLISCFFYLEAKAACAQTIKDATFGCLEFWSNRYQSLVGNLLTAVVAGATLLWVARQFRASDKQAAAAAAEALYRRTAEFADERKAITRGQFAASRLSAVVYTNLRPGMNHAELPKAAQMIAGVHKELQETIGSLEQHAASDPKARYRDRRQNYAKMLISLVGKTVFIQAEVNGMIRDPSKLSGYEFGSVMELAGQIHDAMNDVAVAAVDLDIAIGTDLLSVWERIREFQSKAMQA